MNLDFSKHVHTHRYYNNIRISVQAHAHLLQRVSCNFCVKWCHQKPEERKEKQRERGRNLCQPPQCKGGHLPQLYIWGLKHLNQRADSTPLYNVNLQNYYKFNTVTKEK